MSRSDEARVGPGERSLIIVSGSGKRKGRILVSRRGYPKGQVLIEAIISSQD